MVYARSVKSSKGEKKKTFLFRKMNEIVKTRFVRMGDIVVR